MPLCEPDGVYGRTKTATIPKITAAVLKRALVTLSLLRIAKALQLDAPLLTFVNFQ